MSVASPFGHAHLTLLVLEKSVTKNLDVQYEQGQSAGVAASDSSDKSKEKSDQKVHDLTFLHNCKHAQMRLNSSLFLIFISFFQTLRRLAQNREAARKSRLRKKVRPVIFAGWNDY